MSNIAHDPHEVVCQCSICVKNRQALSNACDELILEEMRDLADEYKDWEMTLLDGLESEDSFLTDEQ